MKAFGITIIFICAAVNASPYVATGTASPYDMLDSGKNVDSDDSTKQPSYRDQPTELVSIIVNCEQLAKEKDKLAKTILTKYEGIYKCITDLSKLLHPDDGAVILIGSNALDYFHFSKESKLFFNKYYVLPKHLQYLNSSTCNEELHVKVFVTAKLITKQLQELLLNTKYEEAVDLSKYIYYSQIYDTSLGREIIANFVNRLLKDGNYLVMNYAFKLVHNGAAEIVTSCFPPVFNQIFNGSFSKILNKDKTAVLRLSTEIDYFKDRWLYSDCTKGEGDDMFWRFHPTWNSTLESVVFEIQNLAYEMKLKLNWQTSGHYNEEREAYGDHRPIDNKGRYEWRLIPTGFTDSEELLFCVVEEVYASYLVPNSCQYERKDVRGIKTHCNPEVSWVIEPSKSVQPIRNRKIETN